MNAADAKNPKFDPIWWRANKASSADASGAFERALAKYQAARKKLFDQAKLSESPHVDELKLALDEVKQKAAAEKGNNKLGMLRKETVEALGNYVRLADGARQELMRLETAPIMKEGVKFLVNQAPQFQEYCKKNFQSESFNFLSLMYKGPIKEQRWYEDFIKPEAKFEVNISGNVKERFVAIAKAINEGKQPNNVATWARAPWDEAINEVERMLKADVVPRFRKNFTGTMMTGKLP